MVNPTSSQDPLENLCNNLDAYSDPIGKVAYDAITSWQKKIPKPLSAYNITPLEKKLQEKAPPWFLYYIAYALEYLFGLSLGVKEADALLLIKKAKEEERLNTLQKLLQTQYSTGFLNCRASKETVPKEGTFSIDPLDLMMGGDGVYLAQSIIDKLDTFSEKTDKTFCAALLICVETCVKKRFSDAEKTQKKALQEKISTLRSNLLYLREEEFKVAWDEIKKDIPELLDQNREEVLPSYVESSLEQVAADVTRNFEITTPKGVLSKQSIETAYKSHSTKYWIEELNNLQNSLKTKTLNDAIKIAIGELKEDNPRWDLVCKPVACVFIMQRIEGIAPKNEIDKWEKMARILSPLHQGIFATVDTSLSSYGLMFSDSGNLEIRLDNKGNVAIKAPKRGVISNYRLACLSGSLDASIKEHASTEESDDAFWGKLEGADLQKGGRAVIGLFDEEISLNVFQEGLNFTFTPSMERPWRLWKSF